MICKNLTFIATSDISGRMRGKALPSDQMESRAKKGVGWTPTNVQITCFDIIADSPYGSLGDLALIPDMDAQVSIDWQDDTPSDTFVLGDILSLDGTPWECCTRSHLKRALSALHTVSGATVKGAFEHEFQFQRNIENGAGAYTYKYYREHKAFAETLMQSMESAGLTPDTFLKEYGPSQFEVTNAPKTGVRVADEAVILRELTYSTAHRFGHTATFTPISDPNHVGNGVHLHISFIDDDTAPITYDENCPYGMSALTGKFIAGVLKYLPSIIAFTAPSKISYDRLTPHRWSAAYNNLGYRDREAAVRICPINNMSKTATAKQYNFEIRALDAAASPHLAMAAIIFAGVQGIKENLAKPAVSQEDLSVLSHDVLYERGYQRLPETLEDALHILQDTPQVAEWFGQQFIDIYVAHKQGELHALRDKTADEIYDMYRLVY